MLRALTMSFLAGMTTMLGALVILILHRKSEKLISASLGLAGGVMICVSFHDLWPNADRYFASAFATEKTGLIFTVIFLVIGVLLAALLDKLVPHQEDETTADLGREHQDLFHVGIVSMLALALHNFPEGMATFMSNYQGGDIGLTVTLAIAIHNIPEGIAVAMPIYFATNSRSKALKYTFLAGISEPIGALIAFLLLQLFLNDFVMGVIFAITAGIMLFIAIEELLPSSRQYGYKRSALLGTFIGITLMPLVHLI
ncbi:MAG: zinc transporter ZupT [Clostridiales bacterium]